MANEQNLIPNEQRTPSERRENAKKAGKASGKARRKKAELKKALNTVLTSKVPQPQLAQLLEDMGFENSFEMAVVFSMANEATKGNVRAAEWISKTMNNEKDDLDRKEQRERIKALKLENERLKGQLSVDDATDEKIAGYIEKVQEALLDEQT